MSRKSVMCQYKNDIEFYRRDVHCQLFFKQFYNLYINDISYLISC